MSDEAVLYGAVDANANDVLAALETLAQTHDERERARRRDGLRAGRLRDLA